MSRGKRKKRGNLARAAAIKAAIKLFVKVCILAVNKQYTFYMSEKREIRKRLTATEWEVVKKFREENEGVIQAVNESGIDLKHVQDGWLKTPKHSLRFTNPLAESKQKEELDFDSVFREIEKKAKKLKLPSKPKKEENNFDRLVYTDTHIGMEPNKDGTAMYPTSWDKEDLHNTLNQMIRWVLKHRKSKVLYIDDLGDFMDGWNGYTTRGGHELPQNMSNQEAFDQGVLFKTNLLLMMCPFYEKVICNNVCNSNHGGDFDYVVNQAVKTAAEIMFENVQVNNITSIMDYYQEGDVIIPLMHGKDTKHSKRPMPAKLDAVNEEKIKNWLIEKDLISPGKVIEVSKGDTHQHIFDYATSQHFDYFCYPALSPSSEYVQTNYKKGKRGFVFHSYGECRELYPYTFND